MSKKTKKEIKPNPLAKKGKSIIVPCVLEQAQREKILRDQFDKRWIEVEEIEKNILSNFCFVVIMALRDEFGFGESRAIRFADRVFELDDSIARGYLSFDDIRETLREELGSDFYKFYLDPVWMCRSEESADE